MKNTIRTTTLLLILAAMAAPLHAKLAMDSAYGDHMVLQRDKPIRIFGTATPGAKITTTLGEESFSTVACKTCGKWLAVLAARKACSKPQTLTVTGDGGTLLYKDVLIGDVWLASGQSNMYWAVKQSTAGKAAIANAGKAKRDATIRILNFVAYPYGGSGKWNDDAIKRLTPASYLVGQWKLVSPESVAPTSAVAYYFAKALAAKLPGVPIGIVHCSKGGTPIEAWIAEKTLAANPKTDGLVKGNWFANDLHGEWARGRAKQNLSAWLAKPGNSETSPNRPKHPFEPGAMWTYGIDRLKHFNLRGVIWYQGESNAELLKDVLCYRDTLPLLISSWRKTFRDESLPVLVVQLPRIDNAPSRVEWPAFRQIQREVANATAGVELAVPLELGDARRRGNVHPATKQPVGERLADVAMRTAYGKPIAGAVAPQLKSATTTNGQFVVTFNTFGCTLKLHKDAFPNKDGFGFEVAGADGTFHPATAKVSGHTVTLSCPAVKAPVAARYAWHMWPTVTLFNHRGIPAEPFNVTLK